MHSIPGPPHPPGTPSSFVFALFKERTPAKALPKERMNAGRLYFGPSPFSWPPLQVFLRCRADILFWLFAIFSKSAALCANFNNRRLQKQMRIAGDS
jgi:hypothetical protein